ncbi:hypothetical protein HJC23_012886 [Cyclotella cryptica]|uniref:DUF1995 domain-containing protein n=1 Tax=Cyclotella cryptica TaxID=29204 RepID=A0ABD3Q2P5_9STRA
MIPITSRIAMPYTLALFLSVKLSIIPVHHAFHTPTAVTLSSASTASTPLSMINVFGGGELKEPQLPKDVKDAILKRCGVVQKGLEDRISRMVSELIDCVFDAPTLASKNKRGNLSYLTGDSSESSLTLDKLDPSNRELARLFVEMFQPLGSSHICTVFNDEYLADQARERWSDDIRHAREEEGNGICGKDCGGIGRGSDSGPFSLPKETEVALFVAPGPKELIAIERICNEVGMGTCVILLNARLSLIDKFVSDDARKLFLEEFEPIWSLSAAPQDEAPGCLMHRAYPGPWMLARKPKVGAPKTIAIKQGEKFSGEECKDAFGKVEISELERGTERLAENMANWFK